MSDVSSGLFVTLEGLGGCGKSTLIETAEQTLPDVVTTAEPQQDMDTGQAVRDLFDKPGSDPVCDLHFFVGHRANHLKHVVRPALQQGKTVICERYADSTRAYQYEKLQSHERVEEPRQYVEGQLDHPWHLTPDITLWLDVEPSTAVERSGTEHKYEDADLLERVRENYSDLCAKHDRIIKVDAEQPEDAVQQFALAIISEAQGQKALQDDA